MMIKSSLNSLCMSKISIFEVILCENCGKCAPLRSVCLSVWSKTSQTWFIRNFLLIILPFYQKSNFKNFPLSKTSFYQKFPFIKNFPSPKISLLSVMNSKKFPFIENFHLSKISLLSVIDYEKFPFIRNFPLSKTSFYQKFPLIKNFPLSKISLL